MEVSGKGAEGFENEAGGHRVQRIPPNEKRGRVHSSTVTVAVLRSGDARKTPSFSDKDFKIEWFSGKGKGGQHRNKHQNCCRVIHVPTGMREARQGRVREHNLDQAMAALKAKLGQAAASERKDAEDAERSDQVGSGMRGDKTFTIRFQDNSAIRHATGARISAEHYMAGNMDRLW